MADTLDDVMISNTEFVDLNALSGLEVGTALIISNKSESVILLQLSESKPPNPDMDGERLEVVPHTDSIKIVTHGENIVWGKSIGDDDALISVQDNT